MEDGRLRIHEAFTGRSDGHLIDTLHGWLASNSVALLAIDAPLGWPAGLGDALIRHAAGESIAMPADLMFRRATDRFVKTHIGKQSLDVGADRIARTAHSALLLLGSLRLRVGDSIPLAWGPHISSHHAIEVYPAATLRAHGITSGKYKDPKDRDARAAILQRLESLVVPGQYADVMIGNADVLDAVVCGLAGMDFLLGQCMPPPDAVTAQREGWIWVRDPKHRL